MLRARSKNHASETEPQGEYDESAVLAPEVHAQTMSDVGPPGAQAAVGATKVDPTDTRSIATENNCSDLHVDAARQGSFDRSLAITDDLVVEEIESPATAVTDDDNPAFLDQNPLSSGDQRKLNEVMTAWTNSVLGPPCSPHRQAFRSSSLSRCVRT
jgi:hypothetical protein